MAGGTTGGAISSLAWVQQPRIDNLGQPDPYGGFPKPDSNIQTKTFQPIGALLPGTVTNVDTSSPWGYAVTVKLDKPLNNLATHTAYLHLGQVSVSQGQHVNVGDVLGTAGAQPGFQQAGMGFALYPGDAYGRGSEWANMTVPNLTGNGLLNPVPLLNQARGIAVGPQGQSQGPAAALQGQYQPNGAPCQGLDIGCWASWIGEHIAIFMIALVLIIVGFFLLAEKQTTELAKTVGKALPFV